MSLESVPIGVERTFKDQSRQEEQEDELGLRAMEILCRLFVDVSGVDFLLELVRGAFCPRICPRIDTSWLLRKLLVRGLRLIIFCIVVHPKAIRDAQGDAKYGQHWGVRDRKLEREVFQALAD